MQCYFANCTKRKSQPKWSLPSEVWTLIFRPHDNESRTRGIRTTNVPQSFQVVHKRIKQFLGHMRRCEGTPVIWNVSVGWMIPKFNGKIGVKGSRLMHGFDAAGKSFFAGTLKKSFRRTPPCWRVPYNAFGYEAHRSREDSLIVQSSMSWRLKKAGISHNTSSYDGTNAFCCTKHAELKEAQQDLFQEEDHKLHAERIDLSCCCYYDTK